MDKKDMSGVLFVNDKGDNAARPDRQGDITVNGVTYRLVGWIKTDRNGNQFISLAVSEQQPKTATAKPEVKTAPKRGPGRPRKDPFADDEE